MAADFLAAWVAAVSADAETAHIGRFSHFTVQAASEDADVLLEFSRGRLHVGEQTAASPDICLRAARRTWHELFDPHAAPRRHDLLSLTKAADGIELVSGKDHLIRHLRVINRLVELGKLHGAP